MTLDEKVDAVLGKLERLDAIESHLLDLLLPQRKAFMRTPTPAPPAAAAPAADDIRQIVLGVIAMHAKIDALHADQKTRLVPAVLPAKKIKKAKRG